MCYSLETYSILTTIHVLRQWVSSWAGGHVPHISTTFQPHSDLSHDPCPCLMPTPTHKQAKRAAPPPEPPPPPAPVPVPQEAEVPVVAQPLGAQLPRSSLREISASPLGAIFSSSKRVSGRDSMVQRREALWDTSATMSFRRESLWASSSAGPGQPDTGSPYAAASPYAASPGPLQPLMRMASTLLQPRVRLASQLLQPPLARVTSGVLPPRARMVSQVVLQPRARLASQVQHQHQQRARMASQVLCWTGAGGGGQEAEDSIGRWVTG